MKQVARDTQAVELSDAHLYRVAVAIDVTGFGRVVELIPKDPVMVETLCCKSRPATCYEPDHYTRYKFFHLEDAPLRGCIETSSDISNFNELLNSPLTSLLLKPSLVKAWRHGSAIEPPHVLMPSFGQALIRLQMSIYDEVLSFINAPSPELFDSLALGVFRYQFESVPVYRQFCLARGASPETVSLFRQIPAASTVAFKYARVRCNAEAGSPDALTFTTSGTTKGFTERGSHLVPRPEIYRASAIAHLRRMLFPDGRRMRMLALHPTADRMPESSLSTMLSWCIEEFGTGATMCAATRSNVDTAAAIEFLDAAQSRCEPVCILGTTSASASLFTAVEKRGQSIALAVSSRLMDTGGAKGQVIPLTPFEVVERAQQTLGIDPAMVINEYGMTEMCSQLYDATPFNSALDPGYGSDREAHSGYITSAGEVNRISDKIGYNFSDYTGRNAGNGQYYRAKLAPPWLRPMVLEPVTLNPLDDGQVGLLTFFDLANVGSISALMTEDFGMVRGGAVTILGRARAGGARGCALSIDEFARREMATPKELSHGRVNP